MQLRHLAQAERHIADGIRHIADRERLIEELVSAGRDTGLARALLATFRSVKDERLMHRERILRELDQ